MTQRIDQFIEQLADLSPDDDDVTLVERLYELTDSLQEIEDPMRAYPSIFEFLENYPNAEIGSPGPLVHFVEKSFPGGYERLLTESLGRKPTIHTLMMANRLLNSNELDQNHRSDLTNLLEHAAKSASVDPLTREQAADYLQYQKER